MNTQSESNISRNQVLVIFVGMVLIVILSVTLMRTLGVPPTTTAIDRCPEITNLYCGGEKLSSDPLSYLWHLGTVAVASVWLYAGKTIAMSESF